MDLYKRNGKLSGACTDMLNWKPRVMVIQTNFRPPTEEVPSLLDHKDVVTLFHEFNFHQSLGTSITGVGSVQDTSEGHINYHY